MKMSRSKQQLSILLPEASINKLKGLQNSIETLKNDSRNQIIEKAIDFYYGYMTSEINQEYLCSIIGQKINGSLNQIADRTGRLAFKEAVEINLLTRLVASQFDIPKDTYDKMRKKAVDDVKGTKGIIDLYSANTGND